MMNSIRFADDLSVLFAQCGVAKAHGIGFYSIQTVVLDCAVIVLRDFWIATLTSPEVSNSVSAGKLFAVFF